MFLDDYQILQGVKWGGKRTCWETDEISGNNSQRRDPLIIVSDS